MKRFFGVLLVGLGLLVGGVVAEGAISLQGPVVTPFTRDFLKQPTTNAAQAQVKLNLNPTTATSLYAFGDSIMNGANADSVAGRFPNQVAVSNSWTLYNLAYGSARIVDQIWQSRPGFSFTNSGSGIVASAPTTITPGQVHMSMVGYNDYRDYATYAYRNHFSAALMDFAAFLAIPTTNKTYARVAAQTGSWTNDTSFGGAMAVHSGTAASTLTFTNIAGSTVYISALAFPSTNGNRAFTVTIDGVSKGVQSLSGAYGNREYENGTDANIPNNVGTDGQIASSPWLFRFPNLGDNAHTVVVTVSTVTDGPVTIYWVAGNGFAKLQTSGPHVFVGNTLRMAAFTGSASEVNVAAFRQRVTGAIRTLNQDGLRVFEVKTGDQFDPFTGMSGDAVHPNQLGMNQLAAAYLKVMTPEFQSLRNQDFNLFPTDIGIGLLPSTDGTIRLTEGNSIRWHDLDNSVPGAYVTNNLGGRNGIALVAPNSNASTFSVFEYNRTTIPFLRVGDGDTTTGTGNLHEFGLTLTAASGTQSLLALKPIINQSGTAAWDGLLIDAANTAVGSGTSYLIRTLFGGVDVFNVASTGSGNLIGASGGGNQFTFGGSAAQRSDVRIAYNAAVNRALTLSGNGIDTTLEDGSTAANLNINASGGDVFFGGGTTVATTLGQAAAAPTVASAATIAPTKWISFVSGTTAIDTITPPALITSKAGEIVLIPTGLWTTTTAGNIALATTAVVNKALTLYWDSGTSKWHPSY